MREACGEGGVVSITAKVGLKNIFYYFVFGQNNSPTHEWVGLSVNIYKVFLKPCKLF